MMAKDKMLEVVSSRFFGFFGSLVPVFCIGTVL